MGFTGDCLGTTGNAELHTKVEQTHGPVGSGPGWQVYCPDEGIAIPPGMTALANLTSGLINPLNEEITGDERFSVIYGVEIVHRAQDDDVYPDPAASIKIAFGGGNHFAGIFTPGSEATLPPGYQLQFSADAATEGMPIQGEFTSQDPTSGDSTVPFSQDGWEIPITNTDGVHEALVYLNILGRKP